MESDFESTQCMTCTHRYACDKKEIFTLICKTSCNARNFHLKGVTETEEHRKSYNLDDYVILPLPSPRCKHYIAKE